MKFIRWISYICQTEVRKEKTAKLEMPKEELMISRLTKNGPKQIKIFSKNMYIFRHQHP